MAKKSGCMERIIRKAIEIESHLDNRNREEAFSLSKLWKLSFKPCKKEQNFPLRTSDLFLLSTTFLFTDFLMVFPMLTPLTFDIYQCS
jgi:hypothetical protein